MNIQPDFIYEGHSPITYVGYRVSPEEIENSEEPILAVLDDDRRAYIFGYERIRVGNGLATVGGTTQSESWECHLMDEVQAGLYARMAEFPAAFAAERDRRIKANKGVKRYAVNAKVLSIDVLTERDIAQQIIDDGWALHLRNM